MLEIKSNGYVKRNHVSIKKRLNCIQIQTLSLFISKKNNREQIPFILSWEQSLKFHLLKTGDHGGARSLISLPNIQTLESASATEKSCTNYDADVKP